MQKALLCFCLLISVGCTTTTTSVQGDPFDRTRPADCVPPPPTPTLDLRPRTPTPNLATQMAYRLSPTLISITMTPRPTPHFIDLSPELPDEDKMVARVYRCDGTWDEYLLDPAIFPDAIPLAPGDIIYDASPPASLMGRRPPEPITPTTSQMNIITAETALPTSIPEETLNAFHFHEGTPITASEQAVVTALWFIGTSRLSYVNIPNSWIAASNSVKGVVSDFITLQTTWGPIVVILSEQGDIKPDDIPLDDYFIAIQRLAVLQLQNLKRAGYNEQ